MSVHAGFDTDQFPGLPVMAALKAQTNLEWCGFYLGPTPSHRVAGWMPHRAALVAQGWGLAPVYLGQETTGPGSHNVTTMQAALDGINACDLMHQAGFPNGSCVYLDLENGPPLTSALAAYVRAALPSSVRIWAFQVATLERTTAQTPFPTPDLVGCGYPAATAWQRAQNVAISVAGHALVVDLDVAGLPDPSAP